MKFLKSVLSVSAIACIVATGQAFAQGGPPADSDSALRLSARAYGSHAFETSVDDADVAVSRVGIAPRADYSLSDTISLSLAGRYEYSDYDMEGQASAAGPIGDLSIDAQIFQLSPSLRYVISPDWSVIASTTIAVSAEQGAESDDATTYGGTLAATYRVNDRLSLAGGLSVSTAIEDDVQVRPFLGFTWRATDKVTVGTSGGDGGFGARVSYAIDDAWTVAAFGNYESRTYRLDDDHAGRLRSGVLQDKRVPVGLSAEWQPSPRVSIAANAGAIVYQEITLEDESGDRITRDSGGVAPFVGLSATVRF